MDLDGGTDPAAALRHVVDEVYAAAPAEFITSRKAWVTRLRKAGLREVATEVAALRKPSVSAAAMNAVVRADDPVVAALVDLGARMRHAQSAMDMAGLSALRGERDEVLAAWVAAARAHAPTPLAGAAEAEVRDTAIAALADAAATEVVTSGSLTRALSYSGFGEVDVADAVARTSTGVVLTRIEGGASAGAADEPRPASGVRRNSRSSTRSAGPEAQDTDAEQPVAEMADDDVADSHLDDDVADSHLGEDLAEPEENGEPEDDADLEQDAEPDEERSDEEGPDEEGPDDEAISRLTMELDEAEKVVAGARAARKEAADADAAARKALTVATEQVAQAERLLAGARRQLEKAEKASTTTAARLAEAEEELTASREQRDAARAALEEAEDS